MPFYEACEQAHIWENTLKWRSFENLLVSKWSFALLADWFL